MRPLAAQSTANSAKRFCSSARHARPAHGDWLEVDAVIIAEPLNKCGLAGTIRSCDHAEPLDHVKGPPTRSRPAFGWRCLSLTGANRRSHHRETIFREIHLLYMAVACRRLMLGVRFIHAVIGAPHFRPIRRMEERGMAWTKNAVTLDEQGFFMLLPLRS